MTRSSSYFERFQTSFLSFGDSYRSEDDVCRIEAFDELRDIKVRDKRRNATK
jgi:hypothetical protein